jgi:hypothetical protein
VDGAVCAEKVDEECEKKHSGLTRHHAKSLVTTSAELYYVYRTWDCYAAALRRHFSSLIEPLFIRGRVRVCRKIDGEYCGDNDAHLDRINVFYHEAPVAST